LRESLAERSLKAPAGAATLAVISDEFDYFDYHLDFGRDPEIVYGTTPFRFSDHDPLVLNLKLEMGTKGGLVKKSMGKKSTSAGKKSTSAGKKIMGKQSSGKKGRLHKINMVEVVACKRSCIFSFGAKWVLGCRL
jgi:hypothetical protein